MIIPDDETTQKAQRILMWHWGKEGAGAKFTMGLSSALTTNNRKVHISAAKNSDLAHDLDIQKDLSSTLVSIFNGDKAKIAGKL